MKKSDMKLYDVTTLCKMHNIELRGEEGQPYCCGNRMQVKSGLIGPDYARCQKCNKTISNMASPHISGMIFSKDFYLKNETWMRLDTVE